MPARLLAAVVLATLAFPVPAWTQQAGRPSAAVTSGESSASPGSPNPRDVVIEAELAADRAAEAVWMKALSLELAGETPDLAAVQQRAAAFLRLRSERLTRLHPDWPNQQVDAFFAILLIDPRRFIYDADFRANAAPAIAQGLSDGVPRAARQRMLEQLFAFDFGVIEKIEVAWGVALRSSRSREVLFDAVDLEYGSQSAIRASIYSLPSTYFDLEEATAFLRSLHGMAPQRQLIVVSNQPLINELQLLTTEMPLRLIDTLGRSYSPWPRDPFVVAKSARGPVTLVVRPNLQAQREHDVFMAREIVQNLPEDLDRDWRQVQWTAAPVPFHGGHMLTTPSTTWVSVHTLLPRVKEILGVDDKIDLRQLRQPRTLARLLAAIDTAGKEFEVVFGRPLRFVHELPKAGSDAEVDAFVVALGGGDGRDLDSLITIAEKPDRRTAALVGDLTLGKKMLGDAPDDDLRELQSVYHLSLAGGELRRELSRAQSSLPNQQFDAFLDASAAFLRHQGLEVLRVPLLRVPEELLPVELRYSRDSFMISWNNVVLEEQTGTLRAEGFASGLATADEAVRQIFADAGVTLDYVAPLALSIMRDGGYRCASNHVR